MNNVCPKCDKTSMVDSRKFCTNCGTETKPMPRCNWCSNELWPYMNNCGVCGRTRHEAMNTSPPPSKITLFFKKILNIKNSQEVV